jgi:hypothetical protein
VVPADTQNATEKWRPIMAAQLPSAKHFPVLKNDTKSETGKGCCIHRLFRVPKFAWVLRVFLVTFLENVNSSLGMQILVSWIPN